MRANFFIDADWPAPPGIQAGTTLRSHGHSLSPYASFNLAEHVGDDPDKVQANRTQLVEQLALPSQPVWLRQVHGKQLLDADKIDVGKIEADGAFTTSKGVVCGVLTADCLPLLMCDRQASCIAAIHVGWRGMAMGIIEQAIQVFSRSADVMAWLGPAIGPLAYEVGDQVRDTFVRQDPRAEAAFQSSVEGKWRADLYALARQRLTDKGVDEIYGGGYCTCQDSVSFYSYRRDGITGRMASLIWM